MSTWSEAPARSTVLRGGAAAVARPARLDSELRSSPFAVSHAVDARLTDPHLQQVVATATVQATEQGRAEGYRAGYAAGLARAAAEADAAAQQTASAIAAEEARRGADVDAAVRALTTAAEAFVRREAVAVAEIENVVADLALTIARTVLDRELALAADPGRDAVARALALAPDDCPATVRLHPEDAARLQGIDTLASGRRVVVVADPAIERGGCVADAAGRSIDTQVGPALARVAAVLR